jgi:hypothetical protein
MGLTCGPREQRIRGGKEGHFTSRFHTGERRWRATSAKVANMLPQTLHDGKNVGAILKVLSHRVDYFLTVPKD